METPTLKYANKEITILWKPKLCIHSTKCWKGLLEVFNPSLKPWINANGAKSEEIIKQINQCPSGALSFDVNNDKPLSPTEAVMQESNVVEVTPNGPLLIYGTITVKDTAGNESIKNKTTAFCRCGASKNKPYCDGSHVKIAFKD
jgi:uncharacterized Fe-S cluster protein YjdI